VEIEHAPVSLALAFEFGGRYPSLNKICVFVFFVDFVADGVGLIAGCAPMKMHPIWDAQSV
jgi:hypothetical protein